MQFTLVHVHVCMRKKKKTRCVAWCQNQYDSFALKSHFYSSNIVHKSSEELWVTCVSGFLVYTCTCSCCRGKGGGEKGESLVEYIDPETFDPFQFSRVVNV